MLSAREERVGVNPSPKLIYQLILLAGQINRSPCNPSPYFLLNLQSVQKIINCRSIKNKT